MQQKAVLLSDFKASDLHYDPKRSKYSACLGIDLNISISYGVLYARRVNPQVLQRAQS